MAISNEPTVTKPIEPLATVVTLLKLLADEMVSRRELIEKLGRAQTEYMTVAKHPR